MKKLPYKALHHVTEIDASSSQCTFANIVTGVVFTITLQIPYSHIENWLYGTLIQNAMPTATDNERELFLTGIQD